MAKQVEPVVLDETTEPQLVLIEMPKLEVIDQPKSKVKRVEKKKKVWVEESVGEVAKKTE